MPFSTSSQLTPIVDYIESMSPPPAASWTSGQAWDSTVFC